MKKNNIFISYRRDGGDYTAKMIHDKLIQLGYGVFYDIESMQSGDFNNHLYEVIEECNDFVVILSPGALDYVDNKEPWIIREVEYALKCEKNIIPVMLRNFEFPEQLPEEIEALRYKNGLPADLQFFGAFIKKLEKFLQSKPSILLRFKRVLPVVIAAMLIAMAIFGAVVWNYSGIFPYPRTDIEKNTTNSLLSYIEYNLQQIEQMAGYMDMAYTTCERQLAYEDADSESLKQELRKYRNMLYKMNMEEGVMTPELTSALQDSPFSAADAAALYDLKLMYQEDFLSNMYYLEYLINNEAMDKSMRKAIMDNYQSIMDEDLKALACGANVMLLPVKNESALEEFKQAFLPQLRYIPLTATSWSYDKKALESAENNCYENINKLTVEYSKLIGEENIALIEEMSQYVKLLVDQGYTVEQAEQKVDEIMAQEDRIVEKMIALQESTKKLEQTQAELDRKKEELKEKFAPADGDSGDQLWGKMLRFLNAKMYDEALACLDAYRETMRTEDENIEQYTAAAARVIRNISNTGIDYGTLIVGYEFGETDSDPRKIGDLIIAVNKKPCHNVEEYTELMGMIPDTGEYTIVVLRGSDDSNGTLEQVQLTVPVGSQRLYLRDMTEKEYD